MRLALLDLGTTALRFEVFELSIEDYLQAPGPDRIERIYRERLMPRLGTNLYADGCLNPDGILQTREFFAKIPELKLTHKIDHFAIAATSALREAENGLGFIRELEALSGQTVRLLSGEEEAVLTARGIHCHESISDNNYLLVDIGGGSTELSHFTNSKKLLSKSIALGAIRGNHSFVGCQVGDPDVPSLQEIEKYRAYIQEILAAELVVDSIPDIIGSSGTIRSLCKLDPDSRQDDSYLYKDELKQLVARLCSSNFEERLKIQGLERNRADIIIAGAIIFEEIFEHVEAERVRVSIYSLRHGLLDEAVQALLQRA